MAAEKRLVRWLDEIKHDAAAVYFLGDVFDYWYEYKYVAPRGHVRFLGKIAELSDLGVEIHLFIGNHDIWMFDYLPQEVGAIIHRKPIDTELLGKRFFLAHGDEVGYNLLHIALSSVSSAIGCVRSCTPPSIRGGLSALPVAGRSAAVRAGWPPNDSLPHRRAISNRSKPSRKNIFRRTRTRVSSSSVTCT